MGMTALLEVDGVKGETQKEGFANHIDVPNYSMSVSNNPQLTGNGWSSGKAHASPFSFSLNEGTSSTKLEELVANGTTVAKVTLKLCKTVGNDQLEVYKTVEFTDCKITSFSESGHEGGDPNNMVSIEYGAKKVEYSEQSTSGGTLANAANYGWDFKKDSKLA